MRLSFTAAELAFRDEVRAFLRDHYPTDLQRKVEHQLHLVKDDWVRWQRILYRKGWAAENWPVEHGGTGWTATQKYIFATECARAHAPRVIPFGLKMVGPIIYTYGSDAQKERFLPDILASEVWWCQGYSEPNAGSDLAALKTTAVRDGDHYRVSGTKSWTTYAQYADWIFCLVRTAPPEVKNQSAISFLLIDMHSPGITVSPIITIDGAHEVNEVHFDDVEVPVENRVGDENTGWTYAKVLLSHERTGIAGVATSRVRLARLKRLLDGGELNEGLASDPVFRHKLATVEIDLLALEFTELRTLAAVSTGQAPGPESSILKLKGTELAQAIDELYLELAGYYALPFVPRQFDADFAGDWVGPGSAAAYTARYFNNRKASIYGGSNEIQKNVLCKSVLGL